MGRKSDYSRGYYTQYEEMMRRLSVLEKENETQKANLSNLTSTVVCQEKTIEKLENKVEELKEENKNLKDKVQDLTKENNILKDDNERMKRQLGNTSKNSSLPPSTDQKKSRSEKSEPDENKSPNEYNGRKKSKKKKGGQEGHKGTTLTKASVKEKIESGKFAHNLKCIGEKSASYRTRYVIDFDINVIATEYRIYADSEGNYPIPDECKSDVCYGNGIRAIAAYLYCEGVMSNDRICAFINDISDGALEISEGSIYAMCDKFGKFCEKEIESLSEDLLNQRILCTDGTFMSTNGERTYIRNISSAETVLYFGMQKKDIDSLKSIDILKKFTGTIEHDHETALYHFGSEHAECNIHLGRYLMKNTEESRNNWSKSLSSFLNGLNSERNRLIEQGILSFSEKQLEKYETRYDQLIAQGIEQNKKTIGKFAKKEEKTLLNRLKKYKKNHLLFLCDFEVPFSNNMSERDLRKCKNRQKMVGGFRSMKGMKMYCNTLSIIETLKRRKLNIFQNIKRLFQGQPVFS